MKRSMKHRVKTRSFSLTQNRLRSFLVSYLCKAKLSHVISLSISLLPVIDVTSSSSFNKQSSEKIIIISKCF